MVPVSQKEPPVVYGVLVVIVGYINLLLCVDVENGHMVFIVNQKGLTDYQYFSLIFDMAWKFVMK